MPTNINIRAQRTATPGVIQVAIESSRAEPLWESLPVYASNSVVDFQLRAYINSQQSQVN